MNVKQTIRLESDGLFYIVLPTLNDICNISIVMLNLIQSI